MVGLHESWEFNVLGIYNYRVPGQLDSLFSFIRNNHDSIPGDIVEAGVFQGKSITALGLFLREIGSKKIVYGYDTFSGFPPVYHEKDDPNQFEQLYEQKKIGKKHYEAVKRNLSWREAFTQSSPSVQNISTSGDFSGNNIDLVKKKIDLLELDNIILKEGVFEETMAPDSNEPKKIMAVLADCDLYQSHLTTFKFSWPRLSVGGMIYLDEYYSLKFPGARIAVNEFFRGKKARVEMAPYKQGDFERWYAIKQG